MSEIKRSGKSIRRGRWLAWGLVLLLVLAGGGWLTWKTWFSAPKGEQYIFTTIQKGDIEDLVSAIGSLQPRDYVDVGAQVSGQVKKIHVEVGNEVHEGDLLAEIDAEQSSARVDANQAQMRSMQAQLVERETTLAKAERDFQRQKNLMAEEATTTETLQNADTTLRATRAQINTLKAQMDQLTATTRVEEANLKYTRIYAPMSGTVVSIAAKQGQTLNANQSAPVVLRIADLSRMTVQTQVSEADVSRLRGGMNAYFTTLGSQSRRWYGQLKKIEPTPTVTNNVVLYNALFEVVNPGTLMTQMTAQVFFVVAEARDVLVAPMSALTFSRPQGGGSRQGQGQGQGQSPSSPSSATSAATSSPRRIQSAQVATPAPNNAAPRTEQRPSERAANPDNAGGERPRLNREAFNNMSEEERQKFRAERMAARAANGESGGPGASGAGQPNQANGDRPNFARRPGDSASAPQRTRTADGPPRPENVQPPAPGSEVRAAAPRPPRKATVRVEKADGTLETREVTVGVSNRVHAQILSGLEEGDRVVAGIKVPDAPIRRPTGNQNTAAPGLPGTNPGQAPGQTPGAGAGGRR